MREELIHSCAMRLASERERACKKYLFKGLLPVFGNIEPNLVEDTVMFSQSIVNFIEVTAEDFGYHGA